ncbi:MAG: hypothetical protein R3D02_09370 [Hyphomicrobiales bacterium]
MTIRDIVTVLDVIEESMPAARVALALPAGSPLISPALRWRLNL